MTYTPTPTPTAGDVVRLDRDYCGVQPGALAVIDGGEQYGPGVVMAVANASAFRGSSHGSAPYVSVSGGPCPAIPVGELVYVGTTERRFWRWKDRPRAGGGEDYTMTVNLWAWPAEAITAHLDRISGPPAPWAVTS